MDTQNGAAQKAAASRAYGAAHAHPIEAIQQDWLRTQLETKHFLMSSVYGAHLPMAMRMEMETLAKVQRLPQALQEDLERRVRARSASSPSSRPPGSLASRANLLLGSSSRAGLVPPRTAGV